jgi:hypothetical protein
MLTQTVSTVALTGNVKSMMIHPITLNLVANIDNSILIFNSASLILTQTISTSQIYNDMDIVPSSGDLIMAGNNLDLYIVSSGNNYFSCNIAQTANQANKVKVLPDNVTVVIGLASGVIMLFNANTTTFGSNVFTRY